MRPACVLSLISRRHASSSAASGVDHYAVLGIRRDAHQKDVKDAFYKLSKLYHPDVNSDAVAHQKFQDITAAYETLGTRESRDAYDMATQPKRLSSATASAAAAAATDYTLSYRLRKKAHEKIRIRTQTGEASGAAQEQLRKAHVGAGTFDEELLDRMREQGGSRPNDSMHEAWEAGSAGGIIFVLVFILIGSVALGKESFYVQKGHRLNQECHK